MPTLLEPCPLGRGQCCVCYTQEAQWALHATPAILEPSPLGRAECLFYTAQEVLWPSAAFPPFWGHPQSGRRMCVFYTTLEAPQHSAAFPPFLEPYTFGRGEFCFFYTPPRRLRSTLRHSFHFRIIPTRERWALCILHHPGGNSSPAIIDPETHSLKAVGNP